MRVTARTVSEALAGRAYGTSSPGDDPARPPGLRSVDRLELPLRTHKFCFDSADFSAQIVDLAPARDKLALGLAELRLQLSRRARNESVKRGDGICERRG
jgi:hypothetical protein